MWIINGRRVIGGHEVDRRIAAEIAERLRLSAKIVREVIAQYENLLSAEEAQKREHDLNGKDRW